MIRHENHIGKITLSQTYLKKLIGKTAADCFGVVGMDGYGAAGRLRAIFDRSFVDDGVVLRVKNNRLYVDLHISVSYGVNISAVSDSIENKVRFVTEEQAGIDVAKINIFIDNMMS